MTRWLVVDWRQAHKFWSVQTAMLVSGFSTLWLIVPDIQTLIPPKLFAAICIFGGAAFVITRLLDQPKVPDA